MSTRVAIVGGARTPFAKAGTLLKEYTSLDLATHSVNGVVQKLDVDPHVVDRLVYGTVIVHPAVPHLAREVNFKSVLPASVESLTVTDNCITGTSAIASVYDSIMLGRAEIGIAGGVESMSNPPVLFRRTAGRLLLEAGAARSLTERLRRSAKLRPSHFRPWSYGIAEPSTGLTMGEHTEITVKEWKIGRQEQDDIALRSHHNAHAATADGRLLREIQPIGNVESDTMIRPDTSLEALARLAPVFDRSAAGTITAGNSSPLTDGAAAVMLMSESRAQALGIKALAYVKDFLSVGIHPADGLLMGPGIAVPRLLQRNNLSLDQIDIVEMHEAFGGQVAANMKAWANGWKESAIGTVDPDRLNPLGSSIAIGHPFAATGARIATTLANEMERRNARYGLMSICGAGATATAMLLER
ncbi:MAG: acetyl-CoA C-acyltransferase [Pseudomonadales bacterium]